MKTNVIYYGDVLGLYINNVFSRSTKTYLSQLLGYSRASGFRDMLFRNQRYPLEKAMLDAINEIFGYDNFISILDKFKKERMKDYKEALGFNDIRLNVEEDKSQYHTDLYRTSNNTPVEPDKEDTI